MLDKSLAQLVPNLARYRTDGVSDDDLVNRYTHERDEEAFAELVRRHGSMVLSVCRRVVRNAADADDAFQATFMVFARKAGTIRPASAVGAWLHGVAFRTAREAVRRAARRRVKESRVQPREHNPEPLPADVRPILDAELARLPQKFAQVLVLCDMEGRTRRDVSELLRVPEGTIASRLARAREALADRLTRRGVGLASAAIAAILATDATAAPPELVSSTARSAFAFGTGRAPESATPGALTLANAMLGVRPHLRFFIAGLVVAGVAVTSWAATTSTPPPVVGEQVENTKPPVPKVAPTPDPTAILREKLAGAWQVDDGIRDDKPLTEWDKSGFRFQFAPDGVMTIHRGQVREQRVFKWTIDATASPPVLVWTPKDGGKAATAIRATFELSEKGLTLSWDESRGLREGRGRVQAAICRMTLSKVDAPAAAGVVAVVPTPQNVVGSRLAGEWEVDRELSTQLGQGGPASTPKLTFVSDPTTARDLPDTYRELFAGKRVYMAGRMTMGDASHRFLLVEHHGNARLVYFVPCNNDEWAYDETATVTLAPGADPSRDLLFLTATDSARPAPIGGFRRAAAKK